MSLKLFTDFGLSAEMMKAIGRMGFEKPAPIQAEALPLLLAGRDVVGQSQTGSGKTAAFAIPAVERLDVADRSVQTLILCPTRELAVQVSEEVRKLAHFKAGVRPLPIYGGQSYERQFAGLRSGANIVIGTPGRVMDHMNRRTLVLDRVRMVVLDEADEMLNMGFREDIEFILKAVPAGRQTVLFSATVPRPIQDLIGRYTRDAVRVQIEAKALTVPTVEQVYVEVDRRGKMEALERLIDLHDVNRAIVFCNTQRMVDELTEHMNAAGYAADCIHGGMAQAARDRVMKKFRSAGVEFLVATDVAARGLDIEDIQVVFNYDLPYDGEDYVHRIGRTGRAGRSGLAVSFVSGREVFLIRQIERYTRQRLHRAEVPTPSEIGEARLDQLVKRVRTTLSAGDFRHYDRFIERFLEEGLNSMDLANALFHTLHGISSTATEGKELRAAEPVGEESISQPVERRPRPRAAARPSTSMNSLNVPRFGERPVSSRKQDTSKPAAAGPPGLTRAISSNRSAHKAARQSVPSHRPLERTIENLPRVPASRRTPEEMTRLWLGVGSSNAVGPGDIKGCILGETGLAASIVGHIDVRERHSFVDVSSQHVPGVVAKLNRAQLGGRKLKAKLA